MKAIILNQPEQLSQIETERPTPPEKGQALVRVHRVGICGTDLHAFRGRQPFFSYPRILGHELGVEIIELGSPSDLLKIGDKCAVEPYLNCGQCIACRRDKPNCCAHLEVLGVHADGGMREFFVVPQEKLHTSSKLSFDQLALVETLGIGAHAVVRAQIERGENALVIGAGPIGLSAIQFAREAGARVLVLDVNANRLRFCREQLGADETVLANDNALSEIEQLTNGDLPTVVFDATGNAASMENAFQFVAPGGRLVFVGLVQAEIKFHDPFFHRRELTLLGSRNATPADFRRIIALLESGAVDTTPWITHRSDFDSFIKTFPDWLEPQKGVIKAMLEL
jgi:2-desacetyl-2-hydroxyethyl bacteriochlorophyllide A dehydrogenase